MTDPQSATPAAHLPGSTRAYPDATPAAPLLWPLGPDPATTAAQQGVPVPRPLPFLTGKGDTAPLFAGPGAVAPGTHATGKTCDGRGGAACEACPCRSPWLKG